MLAKQGFLEAHDYHNQIFLFHQVPIIGELIWTFSVNIVLNWTLIVLNSMFHTAENGNWTTNLEWWVYHFIVTRSSYPILKAWFVGLPLWQDHMNKLGALWTCQICKQLPLKVLVTTIDAQWEGMGDVGSARYEPALLPPCPTIRVLSYSN